MAFITGVDVGGRIYEEEDEQPAPLLALPAPRRRQPKPRAPRDDALVLSDGREIQFGSLLKETLALTDEDPLEELRRMVKKTRGKLDSQTKVLNGFISTVNQVRGEERSFSCTDLVAASGSGRRRNSNPAIAAPLSQDWAALGHGGHAALPPSGSAPRMLKGPESALAVRRPGSANAPKAIMPLETRETRVVVQRGMQRASGGMGQSRSTPSLMKVDSKVALQAPPTHVDMTPLQLPARRAPPGAPGSGSVTGVGSVAGQRSAAMRRVRSSANLATSAQAPASKLPPLLMKELGRAGMSR